MTVIGTMPLAIYEADFRSYDSIIDAIKKVRTHLAAGEGVNNDDSLIKEIRIPYNVPIPSIFDNISKSLASNHHEDFLALITEHNWGCIHPSKEAAQAAYVNPPILGGQNVQSKGDFNSEVVDALGHQPPNLPGDTVEKREQNLDNSMMTAFLRGERPLIPDYTFEGLRGRGCRCKAANDFEFDTAGCPLHDHPLIQITQREFDREYLGTFDGYKAFNTFGMCPKCGDVEKVTSGGTCRECGMTIQPGTKFQIRFVG